jgi:hypothetical protein
MPDTAATTPAKAAPNFGDVELEALAKEIEHLNVKASLRIGECFAAAQEIFRYRRNEGGFTGWIESRLKYSTSTVYRLIDAYKKFGCGESFPNWETLPVSALYLLAAPSTPESAVEAIADRIDAGEKLSCAEVTEVIAEAKGKTGAKKPAAVPEIDEDIDDEDPSIAQRKAENAALFADTAPEAETLFEHWSRESKEARAAFLDAIGVQGVLDEMSPAFGRDLRDRVPAPKPKVGKPDTPPGGKKPKTITLLANPPATPREDGLQH